MFVIGDNEPLDMKTKENIELYFKIKRKEHSDAVKTLLNFDKYEQKHKLMVQMFEKMFDVIHKSREFLEKNPEYEIGNPLPMNNTEIVVNILQIIDNCALFANLVLKLPDISQRLIQKQIAWNETYSWCFNFTNKSNLIDDISTRLYNLAAQQLNIIPRESDFINPYEKSFKKAKQNSTVNPNKSKKIPSKMKKGPRMSKAEL